jgi:hypothetical protein
MTVFAVSLFALAALLSVWVIAASWRRYGQDALALRSRLKNCPETILLTWKVIERAPMTPVGILRRGPAARPSRRPLRPGLAWPGADRRLFDLAA